MNNFQRVAAMNTAFGNPRGNPQNINWLKVQKQCLNIPDEIGELFTALGGHPKGSDAAEFIKASVDRFKNELAYSLKHYLGGPVDVHGVRDALCDIPVFTYGGQHMMGVDGNRDMNSVLDGVMTRFIKDDADKAATIAAHAAKGVTDVYFENEYPTLVMKSAVDQPDAPAGKFLKSASYVEPVFYDLTEQIADDVAEATLIPSMDITRIGRTFWGGDPQGYVHVSQLTKHLQDLGYTVTDNFHHPDYAESEETEGTEGTEQATAVEDCEGCGSYSRDFQQLVKPWMLECFGAEISADKKERNHRFYEESTELVQALGMSEDDAHALVQYVYNRPVGEPVQEVGGVMVTLAALCLASDLNMHVAADQELERIWTMIDVIRRKQAAKPKMSPLPQLQKSRRLFSLDLGDRELKPDELETLKERFLNAIRQPVELDVNVRDAKLSPETEAWLRTAQVEMPAPEPKN